MEFVHGLSALASKCVQEAVQMVKDHHDENYDRGLDKRAPTLFANEHRPELDISEEVDAEEA